MLSHSSIAPCVYRFIAVHFTSHNFVRTCLSIFLYLTDWIITNLYIRFFWADFFSFALICREKTTTTTALFYPIQRANFVCIKQNSLSSAHVMMRLTSYILLFLIIKKKWKKATACNIHSLFSRLRKRVRERERDEKECIS